MSHYEVTLHVKSTEAGKAELAKLEDMPDVVKAALTQLLDAGIAREGPLELTAALEDDAWIVVKVSARGDAPEES